jgi:glutaredoxin 3
MKIELITRHTPPCVYCESAKGFLDLKKVPYEETIVGEHDDITIEELKQRFPTARTFPVVLVDGKPIGGFQQLKDYFLSAAVSGMSL